jgi:hypothetical protein
MSPNASTPIWLEIDRCVWQGPEDLLDKQPLAAVPQYRDNLKLARFFHHTLDIRNANWEDYLTALTDLRDGSNPTQDIHEKVSRLYALLSEIGSRRDRARIR